MPDLRLTQVEKVQIEVAYDALLMKSMKARLSGELKPARDVRFADVQKYRPAPPRVCHHDFASSFSPSDFWPIWM